MKNSTLIIVLTLILIPFFAGSQTQGTLSVSTTTSSAGGNYSYYDFVKGPLPDIQAPTNVSSFSGISLAWQPSAVGYTDQTGHSGPHYLFDPGQRLLRISDNDNVQVMLYDLGGRLLYSGRDHTIDLKSFPAGVVVLKLKYDTTLYTAKLLLD